MWSSGFQNRSCQRKVKLRLSSRDGFVRPGVDTAQRAVSINPLKETIMTAAVLDMPLFQRPISAPGRNATALQTLMNEWEREAAADEEESETELMVMLSGMVSPSAMSFGDE
jgi:hypothetical protein